MGKCCRFPSAACSSNAQGRFNSSSGNLAIGDSRIGILKLILTSSSVHYPLITIQNLRSIIRMASERLPNPLAVIISVFLNGALIVLGIFAARASIVNAKVCAGPATHSWTKNIVTNNNVPITQCRQIISVLMP